MCPAHDADVIARLETIGMTDGTRIVNGGELSALVDAGANRDVMTYLAEHQPSCHDDTSEAMLRAAEGCGEWVAYSPSFEQYRYVALVTKRRIFALGIGQRSACYRLPPALRTTALQTGAVAAGEIGPAWVRFELFRADWPRPDLAFWTLRAYAFAREDAT
jgi:hypothetical protein